MWRTVDRLVDEKVAALDRALAWVQNQDLSPDAVSSFLDDLTTGARMSYGALTTVEQTTFDELVSAGRLELVRDVELRRALMFYYYRVGVQRTRVISRETQYAPVIYELVPRDPEFTVAPHLSASDKARIVRRAQAVDLESLIIAERNRGRLRREVAAEMLATATDLLKRFDAR